MCNNIPRAPKALKGNKKFNDVLEFYKDLNKKVFKDMFFSEYMDHDDKVRLELKAIEHERNAMLMGQMGTLYSLCPLKYHEVLSKIFGENHIEIAKSYNNLGLLLKDLGDLSGAKE